MILTTLKNIKCYLPSANPIRYCIEYFIKSDIDFMPDGIHKLTGGILLNINSYNTKLPENTGWEGHRKMIDIQIMLSGKEGCDISSIQSATTLTPYNEESDIEWFSVEDFDHFTLNEKKIAIFFPEDIHRPGIITENKPLLVRKAIFKIPIERTLF